MHTHKVRIKSDRYDEHMESMKEYGIEEDAIPVDLYGKRVFKNKNDANNLENANEDIKDFYDLNKLGLRGGE